ncbi:mismatch-specific DNA-glycosylase [Oleiagrimonas citrea]|jgi:double-stranded uracil-DNA glycosylase|uniref:Mismatch-specific DNA-glycosylase n=1 Tax=Oleiagrimonas citrea TaxID=1665687 RepID=A0A846ZMR9_9GAMM|nr:mismatch-specific DNA-glycosylase [Oleiagrimonas citrea]NKZ38743.1 mismatch-specific DNA-glycosylase [Oleiagrimonas citrea]
MPADSTPILPDMLQPGLRLVFCGTAPSRRSASEAAYYAHPGNAFWRALHEVGITPRRFAPTEFPDLLTLGVGLTDLAKHHSGNDNELPRDAFDIEAFETRIRQHAPGAVAFTSKNAARAWLRHPVDYGWQEERIGDTRLFVLPSPSGQARAAWRIEPWQMLSDWLHAD